MNTGSSSHRRSSDQRSVLKDITEPILASDRKRGPGKEGTVRPEGRPLQPRCSYCNEPVCKEDRKRSEKEGELEAPSSQARIKQV